jgi:hypothetical protein
MLFDPEQFHHGDEPTMTMLTMQEEDELDEDSGAS